MATESPDSLAEACILDCSICQEPYSASDPSRQPLVLPMCGHSLCKACLDCLPDFRCPVDRTPFRPPLPKNFALIELLERLAHRAGIEEPKETCKGRNGHDPASVEATVYCKECDQCWCEACQLAHDSIFDGHEVVPVDQKPTTTGSDEQGMMRRQMMINQTLGKGGPFPQFPTIGLGVPSLYSGMKGMGPCMHSLPGKGMPGIPGVMGVGGFSPYGMGTGSMGMPGMIGTGVSSGFALVGKGMTGFVGMMGPRSATPYGPEGKGTASMAGMMGTRPTGLFGSEGKGMTGRAGMMGTVGASSIFGLPGSGMTDMTGPVGASDLYVGGASAMTGKGVFGGKGGVGGIGMMRPPVAEARTGSLTADLLASAPVHVQKRMLGDRLFPKIASLLPDFAGSITGQLIEFAEQDLVGKITGMMLEWDSWDLLALLEDEAELRQKVDEALQVLQQASF